MLNPNTHLAEQFETLECHLRGLGREKCLVTPSVRLPSPPPHHGWVTRVWPHDEHAVVLTALLHLLLQLVAPNFFHGVPEKTAHSIGKLPLTNSAPFFIHTKCRTSR